MNGLVFGFPPYIADDYSQMELEEPFLSDYRKNEAKRSTPDCHSLIRFKNGLEMPKKHPLVHIFSIGIL